MRWARFAPVLALLAALSATADGGVSAEAPSYGLVMTIRPPAPYGVTVWDGRSQLRLFESGRWRDATPGRLPGAIHDVFFLDRQRGWLIATDCTAATGALFRTTDGGRKWRRLPGRWIRNCSAGSTFYLDFADPLHGWITAVDPHAADGSVIHRTTNGGRRWRLATKDRRQGSDGPVRFVSATLGWRATTWMGWPRLGPLYRTQDGGRSWAADPALPENRRYANPALVGNRVVTAGVKAGRIAVYERYGGVWRKVSAVRVPRSVTGVAISAPSDSVRWLASGPRARLSTLLVSVDGGRTWSRRALPPETTYKLAAKSATEAWLTANGRPLRTTNGGRTWRPVSGLTP